MILIDINKDKIIEFKVSNPNSIKNIQLIIEFPNDVIKKYTGNIIIDKSEVHFTIPSMKDIIKEKIELSCYLEIEDIYGAFHKLSQDTIIFNFLPIIEVVFHNDKNDSFDAINKKEAYLDNLVINTPNINFKKSRKKLSRKEISVPKN